MTRNKKKSVLEFAQRLSNGLGDNLISTVSFGTLYRDGYAERYRAVNLLVIVRSAKHDDLKPIEPDVARWVKESNDPPLIFTQDEWERSADVFPIEIEEMREAHIVHHGDDPFRGITIDRHDLRQELEREIRGKLLRLRALFTAAAPDGKKLERLLTESAATFLVLIRATLRLGGETPPSDIRAQVEDASRIAGFQASQFDWIVAQLSGHRVPKLEPFDPIAERYVNAIEVLNNFVDKAEELR